MPLLFSISGLRGIVHKDLTVNLIRDYAVEFGRFTGRGKFFVGRDTRASGRRYTRAVIEGLNSVGCRVIDLGIVPTPTVLFMVKKYRAKGGIIITASHNPIQWNALKFVSSKGRFLNNSEFTDFSRQIKKTATRATMTISAGAGKKTSTESIGIHIDQIARVLKPGTGRLSVGVDAVNGAGSIALPKMLEAMGCKVFRLHCRFRHEFSRPPEPVPRNITGLSDLVRERNLDLGFACDPDCDRLAIIDDRGRAIGEDKTLALAVDYVLEKRSGAVVTNLSTTALLDDIAEQYGSRIYRTKVGEANVVTKMLKVNALIGGEGNGGVIYPRLNYTRDALVAAAIIVKLLGKRKQTVSQIVSHYPVYYMRKDKIRISKEQFEKRKTKIISIMKGRVNHTDGIKITGKNAWLHIRPSQTEPLVRIISEAKSQKMVMACVKKARYILGR
jgi:phosphomannomutase